jgi:hypothetical protein
MTAPIHKQLSPQEIIAAKSPSDRDASRMEGSDQMKVPKHVVEWVWSMLTEERKAELRECQVKIDAAKLAYAKTLAANRTPGWVYEVARRAFE